MRLVSGYYDDAGPFMGLPGIDDYHATANPDDLKAGDVLVIWGGEDISPSLYNKPLSSFTHARPTPSKRDACEWALMKAAVSVGAPIMGVCRGAQMACALAGGFLIQHVNGHGGYHDVTTYDGRKLETNSIHHQMMYPWPVAHEMLASIKEPLSKIHIKIESSVPVPEEPEFVYFPEVKAFAVQWHPEMMDDACEATQFVFDEFKARFG